VLLDSMYELPSAQHIAKVAIDEKVINGETEPYTIYKNVERQCASAD
jgi:ATP-dependent Clp protease ATP-binding subunit ClpX